ncbi:MAG TPA: 50S ribosomal protein L3 [Gemmatimonadales bacterium]|jgi:large subunit ribosomal protein L3|uniref:Large ribosomal subunit protein uL3 n=1 Tax=uncultured Gemmatimonadetes bacterium Rifle_16ft_4_minimus_1650 TaxID=1665094 RepID=A0A0H4T171_9BACT|nr:50S ribosomal protein L3, large subunit ribosomal protein L3 [uncultured Gemmatimonadetes bacterium Rifle_16ft_4_minimus_1650]HLB38333.1 50S ribosomal protein L3 [Gemmatimonadales bacterium]
MDGIIGRKLGMTRLFEEDGRVVPVTVIEAGPCPVLQVHTPRNGRWAVQLGFGQRKPKRAAKAQAGHAKKAGLETVPFVLKEFGLAPGTEAAPAPGHVVTVDIFQPGEWIKVTGISKGRGFQGVVKRHGFGGGPATHGNTRHRKPGSVGPGTDPSRVIKGKRMPGHMGARRHTEVGLKVVKVDAGRNLLFVRGAVPGPTQGILEVRRQGKRSRYA